MVVVDEASMVDLALMTKLVEAVPASARLILLGDKDQLVSVEAGAILGDIYAEAEPGFSPDFAQRVHEIAGETAAGRRKALTVPAIQDCLVHLTRSYRYPEGSAIAEFARAVNRGDAEAALAVIDGSPEPSRATPTRPRAQTRGFEPAELRLRAPHEPLLQRRPELEWVELRRHRAISRAGSVR